MPDEYVTIRAWELRQLKDELYAARSAVINLMPDKVSEVLGSYYRCKSTREYYAWCDETADQIITLVPPDTIKQSYHGRRASCPLCGSVGHGPYADGFTVPEGMRRHLTGYGNTHHCPVTKAAFELGRDYVKTHFGEAEAKAAAEAKAEKIRIQAQRRLTEVLYRIHPTDAPKLNDEGSYRDLQGVRNVERLTWAERRANSLGLRSQMDGNVKTNGPEL
jgi:hypothetical protein